MTKERKLHPKERTAAGLWLSSILPDERKHWLSCGRPKDHAFIHARNMILAYLEMADERNDLQTQLRASHRRLHKRL